LIVMDRLAWVGCVLLLSACTRDNGAFDGGGGTASSTVGEDAPPNTDGLDAPGTGPVSGSASGSASASGVDANTIDEGPALTTGDATSVEVTTTGAEEGPATTATTGEPQDCCVPSVAHGCRSDAALEAAVCAARPACCDVGWAEPCVELVALLGLGDCGVDIGQCCMDAELPGCALSVVEQCVCSALPECCGESWRLACVHRAATECFLEMCDPPSTCCFPHNDPGCDDPATQACVCAVNGDCCGTAWIEGCVDEALMCAGNSCVG
jgi:hypothetical protein